MLAFKIKNLLKDKEIMSLAEIARELNTQRDVIKEIIDFWVKRGRVTKFISDDSNANINNQCCDDRKGCNSCVVLGMELYRLKK